MKTNWGVMGVLVLLTSAFLPADPPDDATRTEAEVLTAMMAQAIARQGQPSLDPAVASNDAGANGNATQPEPASKAKKKSKSHAKKKPDDNSETGKSDGKTRDETQNDKGATTGPTATERPEAPPPAIDMGEIRFSGQEIVIESLGSGNLLIHGQAEDVAILRALIEQLDRDVPPRGLEILTLENKKAADVAKGVQEILRDLYEKETKERPQDRVTVSALSTNIILIAAPTSKMDQAISIIRAIDAVPPPLPPVELMTFDIEYRKPSEAAEKLEGILTELRKQLGAEAGPEFNIVPYDDTGKITVFGPVTARDKIQSILDQIDAPPREGFGEIKLVVFPLLNNKAKEMADTLKELLAVSEGKEAAAETIRRLRMVKYRDGELTEELPAVDLEKPLKVIPDDGTESLIIATVEENIEPISEIVALLDQVPIAVEMGVQIYPLRYADAEEVAKLLEDMFEAGKKLPKPAPGDEPTEAVPENATGQALVYNVGIVADMRTNTLIASGRPAQMALVHTIITQIDQPSTEVKFPLRLLELQHSDATRIGKVIEELFDKRVESLEKRKAGTSAIERERVFVTTDIRSNSLVISASEENYAEIVRIVEKLDSPSDRLFEAIRIINCANTSAADLQSKIDELWKRKADLRREGDVPEDLPVVVADQRSNSLVIASSPEDFEEIKSLVERLEAQPLAPIAQIRLVALDHNDATEVADMLKSLFEERMQQRLVKGQEENPADRVALVTDPTTNTILIASSKENFDEMMHIIDAIDVEPDLEGVVRVFFLRNAVAKDVAERIKDLFAEGIYHPSRGLDSKLVEERQKVALVDDPRSNAIIASASKTNLSIIDQLIRQMDSDEPLLLQAKTSLFQLEYADAVQLADMLEKMFQGIKSSAKEPDLFPEPTIIPDERSNTLIVTGTRDALKRCEDLLAQIDVEAGPPTATFEVYPITHASAARLAPRMQEMFEKRDEGKQQERTPIHIQADEPTNALICTASRDDHSLIVGLLRLLDKPSSIARQFEIFPLRSAKAEALAEKLDGLFQSQAKVSGGADRADVLAVEPDPRTNALIVWAAPSEMTNIAHIIERLDTTEPAIEMMVKVIRLKRALAEDFAEVLNDTLNGDGAGQGQDAESVIVAFEDELPDGTTALRKLLRQDITITPDPRTNSLMVMAPLDSMEMLESLITAFDRIPPQTAEIRLFPLVNADAEEVVEKLEDIFEEPTGAEGEVEQQLIFGEGGAVSVATTAGPEAGGLRLGLRFAADRRTNTVIAAGHEVDLHMVDQLIRSLDIADQDERINEVVRVQYNVADDVAGVINDFAGEERDRLSEIEEEAAALRRAERHVTVIPDESSNSLLLGVSPRYYSQYMSMIHQIDRPPPQVMIQVLIAEVSLDNRLELGIEFAAQDLSFSENAVVGPNGTIQGKDFDLVVGTDVGATGTGGGFSFAITGEDFNFLFRALQSDGILEVLSRPTILVENNEEANITIGDRVPFVTSTSVTDSGQVNSQVQYEEVGIILDVTPHINPDGYVNLEVRPEISGLSPSSVQISEGLTAPTFTMRSAETVVTVKDGETVVIGGLITSRDSETETKVPILGDIPGLGLLFRSSTHETERTELLIVLTVDVIRDEDDAYAMSIEHRDKGYLPERIRRHPLMEGLRILPEEPGLGPTDEREEIYQQRLRRQQPDRDIYGPKPEVYGPRRPQRVQIGSTAAPETYGPALVSHESGVASQEE